ncbi:hypothetical protein MMC20_006412 [Loxospora ochrophaea]|nr:hypothetical protein [Loxospora ochrophaea]
MTWSQLTIDKPHLAYIIIGGFTSLFMLCSLLVKEKFYIGEATVATLVGVIFGPHAANLFDPSSWGNVDKITLECSRIVLVVQCFAVGVELPKAYMERHWKSVVFLLVPVMTYGWLMTSLFIWWMIEPLTWLESLACASCVTATDPVLASSVVGKGKFAKRVPKHLRDVLSAESGCNDGMAFPFIYLSLYLIKYRPDASEVAFHWICLTILYECIFGAIYGVSVGYIARHAIKFADRKGYIDRESFLVFYFVLALFCAGSGSLLGIDDLLVGFSAGVGFSNDGWFTQKTEETHVSNVIDLLLNLSYFVFLGSVIPWQQYNVPELGITPWKLVVIAIFVIFFRRIPVMMLLKPIIPDVKTWREALFAGHFGPIGVGAIFASILARAELETDSTEPLAELPGPDSENYVLIQLIWPITTFLVISSILVHGSSIAVFTLGKRINTLSLTMSYTQANEEGPSWMNRLPRIQSTAKSSFSKSKGDELGSDLSDEKLPAMPPGTLPPIGFPGNFLRRQKEEDDSSSPNSRSSSMRPMARRRKKDSGLRPGGPISQSAIAPFRMSEREPEGTTGPESDELDENAFGASDQQDRDEPPDAIEMREEIDRKEAEERSKPHHVDEPEIETYQEGDQMIVEDEEGNVVEMDNTRGETEEQKKKQVQAAESTIRKDNSGKFAKGKNHPHEKNEGQELEHEVVEDVAHPSRPLHQIKKFIGGGWRKHSDVAGPSQPIPPHKRGPAHAYQYGNTIIVEDEDGEVVKKYDIPSTTKSPESEHHHREHIRAQLHRMGTWAGLGKEQENAIEGDPAGARNGGKQDVRSGRPKSAIHDDDDDRIRFTVEAGGRRMSKMDFIKQIQALDPKARCEMVEESDVPEPVKQEARQHRDKHALARQSGKEFPVGQKGYFEFPPSGSSDSSEKKPEIQRAPSPEDRSSDNDKASLAGSEDSGIPTHDVSNTISRYSAGNTETAAAARRRRLAASRQDPEAVNASNTLGRATSQSQKPSSTTAGETNAERRRRLAALGESAGQESDSDSEDDGGERRPEQGHRPVAEPVQPTQRVPGIRFADSPAVSQGRVQWGEDVGRRGRR